MITETHKQIQGVITLTLEAMTALMRKLVIETLSEQEKVEVYDELQQMEKALCDQVALLRQVGE